MHEPITLPSPTVDLNPPPSDKWESELQAFTRLLPQLLPTHRGQFVAVHEGRVVETGADKLDVAMRAYGRFGYVPIYVGLVSERPLPPERLPHRREVED